VNGDNAHPIFQFLKSSLFGKILFVDVERINWNFTKFLVDKNGIPIKRYEPKFAPKDIENDIIELLKK
jgi:glutathione peroxidase